MRLIVQKHSPKILEFQGLEICPFHEGWGHASLKDILARKLVYISVLDILRTETEETEQHVLSTPGHVASLNMMKRVQTFIEITEQRIVCDFLVIEGKHRPQYIIRIFIMMEFISHENERSGSWAAEGKVQIYIWRAEELMTKLWKTIWHGQHLWRVLKESCWFHYEGSISQRHSAWPKILLLKPGTAKLVPESGGKRVDIERY